MPVPKGFRETPGDYPSGKCARGSFRIKVLTGDKRIVICCPRGQWKRGRCTNGMKTVKVQTRVSGRMSGRKGRRR